jgi:hypothetical protein
MHLAAATQSKICEFGSLVLTSMVRDHGQKEEQKVERRRRSSPDAQVHTWPAWRGSARAAEGSLHRGTTGSTALGASTGVLTHTEVSSKEHRRRQGETGEVSSSVVTEMQNPERDPTTDLLGEEAAGEMIWWRLKRTQGRVFRPRWRRRRPPELAGIARRRRRRSRSPEGSTGE